MRLPTFSVLEGGDEGEDEEFGRMEKVSVRQPKINIWMGTDVPSSQACCQPNQHLDGNRRTLKPGSLSAQNQHLDGHKR